MKIANTKLSTVWTLNWCIWNSTGASFAKMRQSWWLFPLELLWFFLVLHYTSFETDFDAAFVVWYLEFSKYYFGSDFKHLILDALLSCWCKYRPTRFFGASLKMGAVRQKQKHFWAGGGVQHYSFFGGAGCIYHFWDGLHYSFCTMNDALSILPCCQCSIAIGETIRLVEFTCKGLWWKSLVFLPTKPKYKLSLNAAVRPLYIQDDGPNKYLC